MTTYKEYINLGNTLLARGQHKKALKYYKRALKLEPGHYIAWNNLGSALLALGRITEAQNAYKKALKIKPSYADPLYSLGVIAKTQGQLSQAMDYFNQALKDNPTHLKAHLGLGRVLLESGRPKEAESHYQTALSLNPNQARAWGDLAVAYIAQEKLSLAKNALEKAISINRHLPNLYFNLGMVLKGKGQFKNAITNFEKAIKLDPNFRLAMHSLFFTKREICDWQNIDKVEAVMDQKAFDNHFTSILRNDDLKLNFKIARERSEELTKTIPATNFAFDPKRRKKHTKIRLGYISRDFRDHPVGQMVTPIFPYHDRKKFETYAFFCDQADDSPWYQKAKKGADFFFDLEFSSPLEVAKLIHRQEIDILIDTTGPMAFNPMLVPAYRPAPIQINWMGILGTTGASFHDYIIGDEIVTPFEHGEYYSEKIVQLPCFSWINSGKPGSTLKLKRSDFGLPERKIVFANFSLPIKIDTTIWKVWMNILRRIPGSVLWLWKINNETAGNLQKYARRKRVDPKRLIFFGKIPFDIHLARIGLADLALDTHIHQGAQTSSSVLGSNTPIITIKGEHFISRVSASMLTKLGLPELIAEDLGEYEEMAVQLALDPGYLVKIKKKLVDTNLEKRYDQQKFVRDLEKAYLVMWKKYCAGEKPSPIRIG